MTVTYTMANPAVVGVFFRALRLSGELYRRGWSPTICNYGPLPEDPKVTSAAGTVRILSLDHTAPGFGPLEALAVFRQIAPDLVVFGEGPIEAMVPLYKAARMLTAPFVVLDQYYDSAFVGRRYGVDRLLLYGLQSLWEEPLGEEGSFALVPPFIDEVAPREELPIPDELAQRDWVTVLGFDAGVVLRRGIEMLAGLEAEPVVVTVSQDPEQAAAWMVEAGLPRERTIALPLQADHCLFGLIAASRAVVLANGFMQIMEALALACPALCIDRGVGMWPWTLNERFRPYVSIGEPVEQQRRRILSWLSSPPFGGRLQEALSHERCGAQVCADHLEELIRRPSGRRRWERRMARLVGVGLLRLPGGTPTATIEMKP
jgi:hypothetical protein